MSPEMVDLSGTPVFAGVPMLAEGNVCANVCQSVLTLRFRAGKREPEDLPDGPETMLA
jgi:hypothetical protein